MGSAWDPIIKADLRTASEIDALKRSGRPSFAHRARCRRWPETILEQVLGPRRTSTQRRPPSNWSSICVLAVEERVASKPCRNRGPVILNSPHRLW